MPDMFGMILKCLAESSSTARHFGKMSGRKTKGCWTFSGSKMSDREFKCLAEDCAYVAHFVILIITEFAKKVVTYLHCIQSIVLPLVVGLQKLQRSEIKTSIERWI